MMSKVFGSLVVFALLAPQVAAQGPFSDLRQRMRESCSQRKLWRAPIRLKGVPLDVGTLVWGCPAAFRLEYRGPGAFEYASNGVEAWIARPSFSDTKPEVEHHWRLKGTDLDVALGYLRGDESKLAMLKANFSAQSGTAPGIWSVTIKPFHPEDFSSLRIDWKLSSGVMSGVQWTSIEGLPLLFDIGAPEPMAVGTTSAAVIPKIPVGARVTRVPALKKK